MFSLWKINFDIFKNIKNKIPSPKCKNRFSAIFSIKKTSRFISACLKSVGVDAGMTVEAALVLPLFLFFFVNLGSVMEMIRLHQNLQMGLWNIGNRLCVYGCAVQGGEDATEKQSIIFNEVGDLALTYTYVKNHVVDYCGENYLESSPLSKGTKGLQFPESKVLSGDTSMDIIDLVMTYQVSTWLEIPYIKPFRMCNRYYGKMWTGYDLGRISAGETAQEMVYVTENRAVYHETLECTHLKLSIYAINISELNTAKNEYGRRYSRCSKCGKQDRQEDEKIFICKEGDFYHYNRECPGLTRIISTVTRQQAAEENLQPCSRCAAKKSRTGEK